jgi:hypothetical protein
MDEDLNSKVETKGLALGLHTTTLINPSSCDL